MMTASIENRSGHLIIHGAIDYDSVVLLRRLGDEWIVKLTSPTIDFQECECCDSSGLALMMSWLRNARRHKKKIFFINVPQSLKSIARACNVDQILGLN